MKVEEAQKKAEQAEAEVGDADGVAKGGMEAYNN